MAIAAHRDLSVFWGCSYEGHIISAILTNFAEIGRVEGILEG